MLFLLAIYLVNEYNEINERNDKTEIAIGKIFFDHQLPNDDSLNNIEIAEKIVGVLYANDHILTAYVFDNNGRLHTYYPDTLNRANLPLSVKGKVSPFPTSHLEEYEPIELNDKQFGTLYIKSRLESPEEAITLLMAAVFFILLITFGFGNFFSRIIQTNIANPIVALSETACRFRRIKIIRFRYQKQQMMK
ncbi:MAG: hypothetical protein EPO57_02830 [Chitinophagaceae bacterium]|nr:MAG: hypothetical protein EPO57_02830 [Chitinophagaceae bacterium]